MSFTTDHKAKFDELRIKLELQNRDQLRRRANGGNSILFAYNPSDEDLYISYARENLSADKFRFIDLANLFVEYIDVDGWNNFEDYYKDFSNTPHLVFKSDDDSINLMDLIINEVNSAANSNLIPVLIRTGALYGTGIENINIMDHKAILTLKLPLVIFYPAKVVGDNLFYLNFKPASNYRCIVIK